MESRKEILDLTKQLKSSAVGKERKSSVSRSMLSDVLHFEKETAATSCEGGHGRRAWRKGKESQRGLARGAVEDKWPGVCLPMAA